MKQMKEMMSGGRTSINVEDLDEYDSDDSILDMLGMRGDYNARKL